MTIQVANINCLAILISGQPNDGLQLRRAITIQAEGKKLFEKHAIAPSAARLCWPPLFD
jgi:hypothetical protein